jgi:hypothetical protein
MSSNPITPRLVLAKDLPGDSGSTEKATISCAGKKLLRNGKVERHSLYDFRVTGRVVRARGVTFGMGAGSG